jgi:hypothetical protein
MRYFALVLVLLALPDSAAAQHRFFLPPIGLPPPPTGLRADSPWTQRIPWEKPQIPWWEKRQLPPWEKEHVARPVNGDVGRRGHRNARVVYLWQPYPIAVQQEPQIIVVQQPPVTRIVEVEVPTRAPRNDAPPREAEPAPPPYVPAGDRTLYVIPGCYVGNVPPKDVKLPANCDLTKVTTYVP